MKPSFAIVGCGRVGTAFALYLCKLGYPLAGVACRTIDSAKTLATLVNSLHFSDSPLEITGQADVVFITTPDGVIEGVCETISEKNGFKEKAVVLHSSGALPSTILSSARRCGAYIGSLHPLQSFASKSFDKSPFSGIITDIEGDGPAVNMAIQIATDLGASSLPIKTEAKTLFHASAVVASNYLVSVLDLAFRLIGEAGVSQKEAWKVLQPLVNGTLNNVGSVGIPEALTGPIARGDVETVARHLHHMKEKVPELVPLYNALGLHTIQVALAKGTLKDAPAAALTKILIP
ncbi:MAG: DUF2520 domain-containing protein [Desulfobacterales bacterium]|jgi:predicted short-subunit dehydrogenase-like oxidoreductase (DUF2520 family)|nr:DUF2520 domain-containing protein [Desulfobacterales bacterium]